MKRAGFLIFAVFLIPMIVLSQEKKKDRGIFAEPKNAFWDEIQKTTEEFGREKPKPEKTFIVDLGSIDAPQSLEEFASVWHNPPERIRFTANTWSGPSGLFARGETRPLPKAPRPTRSRGIGNSTDASHGKPIRD